MTWFWRRDKTHATGGEVAHRKAVEHLAHAYARDNEVRSVASILRELKTNNGFLDLVENAIAQRGPRS
jgi:hypothetical protein